ncbi:glycosyltransferase family 4 protein [Methylophaga sp.]|uniref:glycosyltransferase family 4 protein n=1 Tax=Methylophaga sp. TaxID=2024840 RepID=UPI003A8F703C
MLASNNIARIFYIIPDLHQRTPFSLKALLKNIFRLKTINYLQKCFIRKHKPAGGIKVIYQHCLLLRELGYSVHPVLMGEYHGNFFHYDIATVKFKEIINTITENDVVIATEFAPYQGLLFKKATKILFLQNWVGLIKWLKPEDKEKNYFQLGYDSVITCSQYCSEYVEQHMKISATTITNGIDLFSFKPEPQKRIPNRILAMSRKNLADLKIIKHFLNNSDYEIRIVDGLTQKQLIDEYQSADIFLATGYPEGFSLPPLEAMACGCMVVGFTGGAGREFMLHNETALVAEDGDCQAVVEMLLALQAEPEKKETIRLQGLAKANDYGLKNTKLELDSFYQQLINSSKNIKVN